MKLSIPENLWSQIGNVCLRALTLFSKFFLMFVVARFLEPADLGNYGLVSASVSFALYAVGLDFYTFTTREVLGRDRASWGGLLKSQAAMSGWLYSALLCVLLIVGATMALDLKMVFWFLCLLFIEHLNQELGRLLIAVQRPNTYGIVLFVRSGAWALPLAFLMYLFSGSRTLDFIFGFWAVSGIFAAIISALVLRRLGIRGFNQAVDWAWVRAGLKVALPLLAGTLAIRAVFTVDRYLVKAISDAATLGAYVLLFGIANVLTAFLDSGVFSFISPKLILASKENKKLVFFSLLGNLALQTFLISAFFLMIALLCIHPLLDIVGKPFYLSKLPMFTWLLVGSIIYALSMVPHYLLYALGNDRGIVASHVVAPIVFVLAVTLFGQIDADLVVPVGMCIAFLVMCVMKIYFAMRALIARGWLALS